MVWQKDFRLIADCHAIRDEMLRTSEAGRAACEIEGFGKVSQSMSDHAIGLANDFPDAWAQMLKNELDTQIYPELVCMNARASLDTFVLKLREVCRRGDECLNLLVGPVKKPARIAVKTVEYRQENNGDLSKWPFTAKVRSVGSIVRHCMMKLRLQVGDILRVTIVAVDGTSLHRAVQDVIKTFDLREGNGRLKNMLKTKKHMPPRMLINVVVRAPGCQPMCGEIQIYLDKIKKLADLQHHYYEIRRAKSAAEILAESASRKSAVQHDTNLKANNERPQNSWAAEPIQLQTQSSSVADLDVVSADEMELEKQAAAVVDQAQKSLEADALPGDAAVALRPAARTKRLPPLEVQDVP